MDLNTVWSVIEPYFIGACTAIGSGGIVYFIVRHLISLWFRKNDINALAERFADSVVNKDIRIDVSALVESRMKEVEASLTRCIKAELETSAEALDKLSNIVADVGEVFTKSKTVTEAQRARLIADVESIRLKEQQGSSADDDVITVKLTGVERRDKMINFD